MAGASPPEGAPGAGHRDGAFRASRSEGGSGGESSAIPSRGLGDDGASAGEGLSVSQPRAPAPRHPWPPPHRSGAGRRGDSRCPARHRLPPPGRREDGRAAILAHLHPLYGPHRLSERRDEQLPLCPGGGNARGDRGSRPGQADPHHDGRALPHHQPPRLVRDLRPRRGRHVAGLLHLQRPGAGLRDRRGDLRRPDAPDVVPDRRRGAGPPPRMGAAHPGISGLTSPKDWTSTTG